MMHRALVLLLLTGCAVEPPLPRYPIPRPDPSVELRPAPEDLARDLCERYCQRLGLTAVCVATCQEVLISQAKQQATGFTQELVECVVDGKCGSRCP